MVPLSELLSALIGVAQKGAHIASIVRSDEQLLELLVQEKSTKEKNPRFVHDFKTLADVVIQEMVRHDLSKAVLTQYYSSMFFYRYCRYNVFKELVGIFVEDMLYVDFSNSETLE